MNLRNTKTSWGLVARVFHWGILAAIVLQIPLGFWMVEVYEAYAETYADDTWVMRTSRLHHTLGFLVLIAALLRLSWRQMNKVPDFPAVLTRAQKNVARINHLFLYLLLIIYPLTGWAALSAYEGQFPIFFFALDDVPRIVPQVPEDDFFNYEFFAIIHRWCWRIGAVVLGLHASAALWHQFIKHDGTLRRMWFGR